MFLTAEQLHDLTGYVQPASQIRWLRANGMQHWVRADGHPKVPSWVIGPPEKRAAVRREPDFDAVRVTN